MLALQLRTKVFNVIFSIVNFAVANQSRNWLYSQNFYHNQRDLCSSIYIEPVLNSREECEWNALRAFCFWRDFCQPACPLAAGFTSKTALNSLEECNEFADHHHESFCLSIDSLSCTKRSLDLCILFKVTFLYL